MKKRFLSLVLLLVITMLIGCQNEGKTVVLKIDDTTGENIYEKTYNILDKKQLSNNTNLFNIYENVKIEYDKYNTIAKQFINQYKISGKANLEVNLHVEVLGEHENFAKNINIWQIVVLL